MIGSDLEYLMSSLPHLSFQNSEEEKRSTLDVLYRYEGDAQRHISPLDILDNEARKVLSDKAFEDFRQIDLSRIHHSVFQNHSSRVVADFSKSMLQHKQELSAWRDPNIEKKSSRSELVSYLKDKNPLQREEYLLDLQWQILDDLSSGHFTDFDALVIYKLKLSLLIRWWSFDTRRGYDKFIEITTTH
ncbi:MAG: DUF2764 family protein [Saprospiraceae bacterium]|nr:DUF2764 family protein [Saprospiraceae bacterium]